MATAKRMLVLALVAAVLLRQPVFVPPPRPVQPMRPALPVSAAVGAAAMLGAAPAYADEIGDAAKKLSVAAYPLLKDVNWNSALALTKPGSASAFDFLKAVDKAIVMGAAMDTKLVKAGLEAHHKAINSVNEDGLTGIQDFTNINAALGRMIASVPESKVMDVYNAFSSVVSPNVPAYLMSTVKEADAKNAYQALMEFKDVVKAHPITPAADSSSVSGSSATAIGDAAKKLSAAAYPFLKEVDWSSDLALTAPGSAVKPKEMLKAIDKALLMGQAMDGASLKEAALAHSKAISAIDSSGVTSQADFEAINAGLGKAIASAGTVKTMDVYNAFSNVVSSAVPTYLMSSVNADDAKAAYSALMEFKDVVKAESAAPAGLLFR